MEASATTVNITSGSAAGTGSTILQQPEEKKRKDGKRYGKHTHGANFNKYVEGCPECHRRCPTGPKPGGYLGPKAKTKIKATEIVTKAKNDLEQTASQLEERIASATRRAEEAEAKILKSEDPMAALVQLMMRREAKTIEKEEDVERRRLAAREDMLRVTRETERQKAAMQAACGHVKENGRSSVNGQVHNDGLYHPICLRCMKEFPPQQVSRESISNGMQAV